MSNRFVNCALCTVIVSTSSLVSGQTSIESVTSPPMELIRDKRLAVTLPRDWDIVGREKAEKLSPSGYHFALQRKLGKIVESCKISIQSIPYPEGDMRGYRGETMRNMDGIYVKHTDPSSADKPDDWDLMVERSGTIDKGYVYLRCSFVATDAEDERQLCEWISEHMEFVSAGA